MKYPPPSIDSLKPFELEVLHLLTSNVFAPAAMQAIIKPADRILYTHSGCGYFLTLRDPRFPTERHVFSDPLLIATARDIVAGYLAFVENGELTLECHTWGVVDLPSEFREWNVVIGKSPAAHFSGNEG